MSALWRIPSALVCVLSSKTVSTFFYTCYLRVFATFVAFVFCFAAAAAAVLREERLKSMVEKEESNKVHSLTSLWN